MTAPADLLDTFAGLLETEQERQKCGVFLSDLAQLSPITIRAASATLRAQAAAEALPELDYPFNPSNWDISKDPLYLQYKEHVNGRKGTGAVRKYEIFRRFGEVLARADELGDPLVSEGLIWLAWHSVKDREIAAMVNESLRKQLTALAQAEAGQAGGGG